MIKLAQPYISEEAIKRVSEVLRSGNLVQGKYVKEFEDSLKSYLNIKHAFAVSSGTAALHLALLALNIKVGDEVIVPAFTFPATANVVEVVGAKPVFVDITLEDYCIDVTQIEEKITPKTKAIIPVHEFGQSADIENIMKIAKKYGLFVIEDAACALGTEFNNQKAGTFGDIGCFSFHPRKAITTGEGGLVVTKNPELAHKLVLLRNHGIERKENKIDFAVAGLNYRMTEFQAVIGCEQLYTIDDTIDTRKLQAQEYDVLFDAMKYITIQKKIVNRVNVYQTYHILLDTKVNRNYLKQKIYKLGIETNFGANALNILSIYKDKYKLTEQMYPNAVTAFKSGLALPLGKQIKKVDQYYIFSNLKQVLFEYENVRNY